MIHTEICRNTISIDRSIAFVAHRSCGALCTFIGVVRDNNIESDRLSLTKFVQCARVNYFDIRGSGIELYNINTPGDYMCAARSISAKNTLKKACMNDGID